MNLRESVRELIGRYPTDDELAHLDSTARLGNKGSVCSLELALRQVKQTYRQCPSLWDLNQKLSFSFFSPGAEDEIEKPSRRHGAETNQT